MAYISKILNDQDNLDYTNWTQSGDLASELRWDTTVRPRYWAVRYTSSGHATTYTGYIQKSFTIDRTAGAGKALLTLKGSTKASPGGTAQLVVELQDADGVWHELLDTSGGTGVLETYLDEEDIKAYFTKSGEYTLRYKAVVLGVLGDDDTEDSYVHVEDVHLQTDEAVLWELTLDEDVSVTETFIQGLSFLEDVSVKEFFTIAKTTPYAATDEKLLCGKTDSKVYEFADGTPEGTFDTRDEDFGLPGQEKTLAEIHLSSSAEAPHTVEVFISVDSGLTWVSAGLRTVSIGTVAVIFVWKTAEAFAVRFKGDGLHLDTFTLYAIPRGQEAPVTD